VIRRTFFATLAGLALAGTALAQTPAQPAAPLAVAPVVTPAPKVFLTTSMGEIEITLDPVGAPKTSAHMLKMFQTNHFIGASFFRIEPELYHSDRRLGCPVQRTVSTSEPG
jgi:hypothetical protein